MASLKDLKNRIASVKSTQKITKAMQMVAAAKLRRAQEAAIAARPYAERMTKVLALAGRRLCRPRRCAGAARRHGQGPGASARRRDRRARSCRRLQLLDRAACPRATPTGCSSEGKTVKILTVGRKGNDILKRQLCRQHRRDDHASAKCARSATSTRRACGDKILAMYANGEFDVATLFFATFKSVISQVPTALQLIPAKFERGRPPTPVR